MKSKKQKQSLWAKMTASPRKAFGKARDMYVKGVTKCSQSLSSNNVPDQGFGGYSTTFPRSYSSGTSSTRSGENDDFSELIRVASARTKGDRIGMDLIPKQQQKQQQQQQQQKRQQRTPNGLLKKCSSVGLPKIDEDKPFEQDYYYPRSRSYAVGKTNTAF